MLACVRLSPHALDAWEMTSEAWQHEVLHTTAEVKPLCHRVATAMTAAGYNGRDVFAVRLALEEAIVNAIKHGNQGDTTKSVRVSYCVQTEEILLNVEDEGKGFDPNDVA